MCTSRCKQILEGKIEDTMELLHNNTKEISEDISICLFSCLKENYLKWTKIAYKNENQERLNFIFDIAFSDAVIKFNEKTIGNELYNGNATVKTIFFSFFRFKLLEQLQNEKRNDSKYKNYITQQITSNDTDATNYEPLYHKLEIALRKLNDKDRRLIILRHKDGMSIAHLASELNLNINSTTNKIYRAMIKLKAIIEKL